MPIRAATVRVQRSNKGRGGEQEEEPKRRGREREEQAEGGRERCTRLLVTARTGPTAHPRPAQRRQQGLNLLSPPLRPLWSTLNTDGDGHCNTDQQSRLHLLLGALCTEQRESSH